LIQIKGSERQIGRYFFARRSASALALQSAMHGGSRKMESATFRKWLVEQGCRIDQSEHHKRHEGPAVMTVHREGRKTEVPLGGSKQILEARVVQRACQELGLDPWQLPGAKSRV
jgi:hypothetical protein